MSRDQEKIKALQLELKDMQKEHNSIMMNVAILQSKTGILTTLEKKID
jgi:hypothetical protein